MNESLLQLLISMTKRREIFIQSTDSICHKGVVNGIQAEDGSGTSFNVTLVTKTGEHTLWMKRPWGSGLRSDDPIRPDKQIWNPA